MKGNPAKPEGQKAKDGDGKKHAPAKDGHEDEVQNKSAAAAQNNPVQSRLGKVGRLGERNAHSTILRFFRRLLQAPFLLGHGKVKKLYKSEAWLQAQKQAGLCF